MNYAISFETNYVFVICAQARELSPFVHKAHNEPNLQIEFSLL